MATASPTPTLTIPPTEIPATSTPFPTITPTIGPTQIIGLDLIPLTFSVPILTCLGKYDQVK